MPTTYILFLLCAIIWPYHDTRKFAILLYRYTYSGWNVYLSNTNLVSILNIISVIIQILDTLATIIVIIILRYKL